MKMRWLLMTILILGAVVVALLITHRREAAARTAPDDSLLVTVHSSAMKPPARQIPDHLPEAGVPPNPTGTLAQQGKSVPAAATAGTPAGPEIGPGLTPTVVLENLRLVFRNYCARFGGNPVGTNPEITRALNGGNPGHVEFLNPEDGMRLDGKGELVDNWGTPFFFHQLSGTEMEIHSAGPDRKMWTPDDLVIK